MQNYVEILKQADLLAAKIGNIQAALEDLDKKKSAAQSDFNLAAVEVEDPIADPHCRKMAAALENIARDQSRAELVLASLRKEYSMLNITDAKLMREFCENKVEYDDLLVRLDRFAQAWNETIGKLEHDCRVIYPDFCRLVELFEILNRLAQKLNLVGVDLSSIAVMKHSLHGAIFQNSYRLWQTFSKIPLNGQRWYQRTGDSNMVIL